jgi:hypothetical protein
LRLLLLNLFELNLMSLTVTPNDSSAPSASVAMKHCKAFCFFVGFFRRTGHLVGVSQDEFYINIMGGKSECCTLGCIAGSESNKLGIEQQMRFKAVQIEESHGHSTPSVQSAS